MLSGKVHILICVMMLCVSSTVKAAGVADSLQTVYNSIFSMTEGQLYDKARKYELSGNIDSMLIHYNVLYNRYNPSLDSRSRYLCALALLSSARAYYEQFNYSKSMELLLECRRLCEANGYTEELAEVYRNIGNIYSCHSDFGRARPFYERSLSLSDSIKNVSLRIKAVNNLIGVCVYEGDVGNARKYYSMLQKIPSDDPLYTYDLHMDGGLVAACDGNVLEAAANYRKAAERALSCDLGVKYSGAAYSSLASLYKQTGQIDSVLYYLHVNEKAARESRQNDLLAETLRELADQYTRLGDSQKAYKYKTEYLDLSDEIFNQRDFNSLKNAEFMYELDKNVGTISMLNAEKAEKDIRINAQYRIMIVLSVTTLIVLILLLIIYSQKRRLSMAYADLFEKNTANLENEKFYQKRLEDLETRIRSMKETEPPLPPVPDSGSQPDSGEPSALSESMQELQMAIMSVMTHTDAMYDPDFSINRLAELVHSNSTYVSRVINEMYGKNFRTVLNECRIKEAMKRMADTGQYGQYTIKAIAESVGYKSQSNFIAVFTKFAGIKPSMYLDMARQQK